MAVRMTGMVSGMDTESIIKELVAVQKTRNKKVEDKQTKLTWTQEKWKELNTKLYSLYTSQVSKMRLEGSYKTKAVTASDESKVSVTAEVNAPLGAHTIKVEKLASAQYYTGGKLEGTDLSSSTKLETLQLEPPGEIKDGTITIKSGDQESILTITSDTTIGNFIDECRKVGLNANFDTTQGRFFISSLKSGKNNKFTIEASNDNGENALDAMKLTTEKGMVPVEADDATIVLNGATLTSESNVISANGMTITVKDITTEPISLNVTNNTQGTYDMVKEFVTKYNEILKEMNTLYYAESARGYDPLSSEEKEQMSEEDVKKWETKIKESLLRRDSTLGSLITSMKDAMMKSVTVGDSSFSLSTFGIRTSSDYTEKGLLHINGDTGDATYALEENKLRKALEEDPEKVAYALAAISKGLYDTMTQKMSAIPNMSSAMTFYNDKSMVNQQRSYTKEISKLEQKLLDMEDRYYKQFTAMEKALSKIQAQGDSLVSLLGSG